jgi:hypothetical protein
MPVIPVRTNSTPVPTTKIPRAKYRAVADREALEAELTSWRDELHSNCLELRQWPAEWILDDPNIVLLARAKPKHFGVPSDITNFLAESEEWGNPRALDIWSVILRYDQLLETRRREMVLRKHEEAKHRKAEARKEKRQQVKAAAQAATAMECVDDDSEQSLAEEGVE